MKTTGKLNRAMIKQLLGAAALCWICSCGLNKEEYVEWVRDEKNGLHQKKIAGNYQYEVQYMPQEYLKLLRHGHQVSREQWEQDTVRSNAQVFSLKITCVNDSLAQRLKEASDESKQKRDYYFMYLFGKDIKMKDEESARSPIFSHFETGQKEYQLAFEGKSQGEATLIIASPLLDKNPTEITVNRSAPKLKL